MQSAGQIRCIGGKELQPEEFVLQAHELPTGAAAMDGQSVPPLGKSLWRHGKT